MAKGFLDLFDLSDHEKCNWLTSTGYDRQGCRVGAVRETSMKPLVSILIPAFNEQECIAETLQSALQQTWRDKEIIVVDDGSTDETLTIAKRFASAGVSIVRQEHQGAAAARNTAFSRCQGDYIQWLDANDLLSPDKIARQMNAREHSHETQTLLSCAWGRFLYRHQRADFTPTSLWCDLTPAEWLLRKLEQGVFMQTSTWLVTRKLTEAAGPWDTRLLADDDGEYFSRVIRLSDGIRFVPDAKVFYRLSGNSRLSYIGRSHKQMDAKLLSMELTIKSLRSLDDSDRARAACVTYLQAGQIHFFPDRPDILERLDRMARALGGRLDRPKFSWKYSWIARMFGIYVAKSAQILLPKFKWWLVRLWDKTLFRMQKVRAAP